MLRVDISQLSTACRNWYELHRSVTEASMKTHKSADQGTLHARTDGRLLACRSLLHDERTPLRLALSGASALTHDAVSSLLRLPALVHLDISGCGRINAMDRMRLLAKIRAGQELHAAAGAALAGAGAADRTESAP